MGLFNRNRGQSTAALEAEYSAAPRTITLTKSTGPAVDRATVEQRGSVDLTKKFDKAGISLSKAGLDGIRAEAVMILDHSGSMLDDYRNGLVQTLVDRALAFALRIDGDGTIPVLPFDSRLWPTVTVGLDNYHGVVDRDIFRPQRMGGTYLSYPLQAVLDMAKTADSPLYVVIVTDDDPTDEHDVIRLLKELKRHPVFVKVLTLVSAPFWDRMDDLTVPGLIDNLDAKRIKDPAGMSDLAFADAMVDEWSTWIELATRAGILQ
ncbi:VWA domain-containing protein [Nocardia asiatica]|uniref:VWA domain-containing protein n=1 Tax=Nocardia asiatica TaxID=209252 RepID=UPI002454752A|nr:VWA domain-containing protein [Nocardia asiatica]